MMKPMHSILSLLACLLLLVTACGAPSASRPNSSSSTRSSPTTSSNSSADESLRRGEEVFNTIGACNTCHTINGIGGLVGPDLQGIAALMRERHPDLSVEAALELEIVDPTEHIAEGFRSDLMPANYQAILTPQQIINLVQYVLSLD